MMRLNIQYRLFLTMLAAMTVVVAGIFFIMQWSIDRGFLQYVNTLEEQRLEHLAGVLERAYAEQGGWDFLRTEPLRRLRQLAADLPEGEVGGAERPGPRMTKPDGGRHPRFGGRFEARIVLLDARKRPIIGSPEGGELIARRPLEQEGRTIGYLGVVPRKQLSDVHQLRFVKEQKLALALVAGVVLLASAGLSFPLARRLVRPIRALAGATHRLAAGEHQVRVPVSSGDELGSLARDFNALALSLEKNEGMRRQWVADISHELRTPLAVLRGEIEALQDGVRQASPEAIASLHGEVMRLERLVGDLYQLALSDTGALTYRKEEVDLSELLADALEAFRSEFSAAGLVLREELPDEEVRLFADSGRMRQMIDNLLENALKYTDPGGRVEVRLAREDGWAALDVQDSAPGVPAGELERLFERLYRVESSRSRSTGGAGLGLSICRNIAEAHGGTILARPSPLGGVRIRARFPLAGGAE